MYSEEVDAEDDEIIRDSLGAQGTISCVYLRIQLIYISQLQLDYIGHFIAIKRLHIHSNENKHMVTMLNRYTSFGGQAVEKCRNAYSVECI